LNSRQIISTWMATRLAAPDACGKMSKDIGETSELVAEARALGTLEPQPLHPELSPA
jgi:hypothetical protein